MRSPLTTLCYVERGDSYLMLHRVSKKNDVNKDKWIGIGGHFEEGESPEECLLREAYEETGLRLTSWKFRGIVTFVAEGWPPEYMCLYTADGFDGGWKEDKGECHACENSVNTDRFNPRKPGEQKLVRYKDGFEALEKAEREAIRHEGECHGEEGEEQGSNRCVCILQYGNGLRASIN